MKSTHTSSYNYGNDLSTDLQDLIICSMQNRPKSECRTAGGKEQVGVSEQARE